MDIVATWHPQTDPSGSTVNMTKTTGKFVFINESSVNMLVTLSNGFKFYLGSSDRRMVCLTTVAATFQWVSVGATSPPGFDNAFVEHYQPGEPMFETYPSPLMRQVNVGNSVNTVAGTAQYLQDDADATPHQFIESTVTGSASSAILILNDGTVTIKGDVAHVLTTLLQLIPGAASGASSVILGDSTRTVEILGASQVDQNAAIRATLNTAISLVMGIGADTNRGLVIFGHSPTQSGNLLALQTSAFANLFTVDPSGNLALSGTISPIGAADLVLNVPTGQAIRLKVNGVDLYDFLVNMLTMNGNPAYINSSAGDMILNVQTGQGVRVRVNNADQALIDATGFVPLNGNAVNFLSGRIFRHRGGASAGLTATITHGMGATPQTVLLTSNIAQPGSSNCGVGNVGATTFAGSCAAGTFWYWVAENG